MTTTAKGSRAYHASQNAHLLFEDWIERHENESNSKCGGWLLTNPFACRSRFSATLVLNRASIARSFRMSRHVPREVDNGNEEATAINLVATCRTRIINHRATPRLTQIPRTRTRPRSSRLPLEIRQEQPLIHFRRLSTGAKNLRRGHHLTSYN